MTAMYSRKDFLRKLINHGLRVTEAVFRNDAIAVKSAGDPSANEDDLFKEAMAMGIDPGSIPTAELERMIRHMHDEK